MFPVLLGIHGFRIALHFAAEDCSGAIEIVLYISWTAYQVKLCTFSS